MKRIIAGAALTVLLSAGFVSITSCDASSFVEADPIATTIRLSSTALAINDADTTRLTAEVLDEEGTPIGMPVTWSSSAPSIAPIGSDGTLVGERPGDALITATAGDLTAEVNVKVRKVPVSLEAVTGSDQQAAASQALPDSVTVRAVDRRGKPVPGVRLDFTVMNGGGVASPEAGLTDTDGMARTSWTLGQNGQQELHAVAHPPSHVTNMKDSVEVFTATILQASPAVATVRIAPDTTKLSVGDSVQLAATAYDETGAAVSGASLTWTSLNPEIATVGTSGWVTARAAGVALISATAVCCSASDTAGVHVDEVVASVTISPASQTVDVDSTAAFSTVAADAQGNPISNYSVTWSSDDTNVATVDGQGVASGVAAGSAGIIATVSGVSDTATLTVNQPTSPPSSGNLVNECASPGSGWIWCDDFDQDRLNSYFEYVNASGAFARTSGVGVDGSSAMRVQFGQGDVSVGSLKLAFGRTPDSYMQPVDAGTSDYRDVYWRVYVRYAPNWTGGGGDKLSRSMILANANWAQAMAGHVWSGGSASNQDYLMIDPASGTDAAGNLQTTRYGDSGNMRWLGAATGTTPVFNASNVGQWLCVEARTRLNDAGQSNGVFELWIDDQLEAQRTGLNWVGAYAAYGINAVFLENYWNSGSPQAQERYLDNFVVSTERIGCGS